MKRNPKWLDVDWVQLGCWGWDIDETGAGYYGLEAGQGADGRTVGQPDCDRWGHIHLDRTTLHIICGGSAEFIRRRLQELQAAYVPGAGVAWVITTGDTSTTYTAGSCSTTTLRLSA